MRPRHARTRPARENGTLTKKIHRHDRWLTIRPPTTGPAIGPNSVGGLISDIIRPSLRPPAASTNRFCRMGSMRPPPTPWSTRKPIRASMFHATLDRIEPTMNRASAPIQTCLAPKRSLAHPATGTTMPSAST